MQTAEGRRREQDKTRFFLYSSVGDKEKQRKRIVLAKK
jgi:hypothetical protein